MYNNAAAIGNEFEIISACEIYDVTKYDVKTCKDWQYHIGSNTQRVLTLSQFHRRHKINRSLQVIFFQNF